MERQPQEAAVLIPSLSPDGRLVPYIKRLLEKGFLYIVVVDDGSAPSYQPIFQELAALRGVTVLHHEKNLGKGCALKTGFRYLREECPGCIGVVTADADGQHTLKDIWGLAERLADGEKGLLLGSRDFSLPNVPKKSRAGNRITTFIFWLLYGRWLPDTQTGLRGFAREYLSFMEKVEGNRFEYEMNMLIACAMDKLPMTVVSIETVYENENKGTHFHPVKDSFRIYRVIFKNFFRFMSSSFIGTAIDLSISFLLLDLLRQTSLGHAVRIGIATWAARAISAGFNFLMNKHFVFHVHSGKSQEALPRYIVLCVVIALLSWGMVTALHEFVGMSDKLAKVLCDTGLFFLSYQVQQRWVFRKRKAALKEKIVDD